MGEGQDPWSTTYTSDENGVAKGSFTVKPGMSLSAVIGHAIVVHSGADKVGCGIIAGILSLCPFVV